MKNLTMLLSKTTYVATLLLFMTCFTFSCQYQIEKGITKEEAKVLVEKDQQIWNEGNLSLVDEIIASDYVEHTAGHSDDIVGIDAFKERITVLRTSYPDFNVTVEELFVKDDNIVWRWIISGTNTGTITSMPATGNKMQVEGIGILRCANGKIVERLIYYNEANMLMQLGYTITPPTITVDE